MSNLQDGPLDHVVIRGKTLSNIVFNADIIIVLLQGLIAASRPRRRTRIDLFRFIFIH